MEDIKTIDTLHDHWCFDRNTSAPCKQKMPDVDKKYITYDYVTFSE